MNKKIYYFTVEGETEREYLRWLEMQINQSNKASIPVKFDILVTNSVQKRLKTLPINKSVVVYHFCDMESLSEYHKNHFLDIIDKLYKASQDPRILEYKLGYSNQSFELWLLLHKTEAYSSSYHRKNYFRDLEKVFNLNLRGTQDFKRKKNIISLLKQLSLDDVIHAINREKEIKRHNELNNYCEVNRHNYHFYWENPSSSIGSCIEEILIENNILENDK